LSRHQLAKKTESAQDIVPEMGASAMAPAVWGPY